MNAFASGSQKACLPFEFLLNIASGSCYDTKDVLDLSNRDLSKLNLDYANFRQINFENSNFTNSSLKHTNFGCCAHNATAHKANFSKADLSFSDLLRKCNGCNFYMANLSFSKNKGWYKSANFIKANLSYSDFGATDFRKSIFRNTVMDFANFSGANFTNAVIEDVEADSAIFLNTTGISDNTKEYLRSAGAIVDKKTFAARVRSNKFSKMATSEDYVSITGKKINIENIDLSGVDLSGSDLRAFSFYYISLNNVDMSNSNLEKVHVIGSPLKNVNLNQANLKKIYVTSTGKIAMENVTLFGADLTLADIRGDIINVRYNSKPLNVNGVIIPPTRFSLDVAKASGKRFHPNDIKGLKDVSYD